MDDQWGRLIIRWSKNGDLDKVKRLMRFRPVVDITEHIGCAVMFASRHGHLEVVKYLVSVGADITAEDNEAARMASLSGYLEIVKYLVSVGADITAKDNYAIRLAEYNGHLEVVEFLISAGADISKLSNPVGLLRTLVLVGARYKYNAVKELFGVDKLPKSREEMLTVLDAALVNKE